MTGYIRVLNATKTVKLDHLHLMKGRWRGPFSSQIWEIGIEIGIKKEESHAERKALRQREKGKYKDPGARRKLGMLCSQQIKCEPRV